MKITDDGLKSAYIQALQRLTRWKKIFVGWQLGTRSDKDGEALAVADQREVTLLMRAELNSMLALLIEKKVFTEVEWVTKLMEEARMMDKDMEARFPGVEAMEYGLKIHVKEFAETQKKLHFKP